MISMSRWLAVLACYGFVVSPAGAGDLTFSQWASGPPDKRAIYVAGVMETVGVYAQTLGFLDKWSSCLSRLKLSYGDVSDGAVAFAAKNETFQKEPAPAVMIAYMNARCGLLVSKPVSDDGWHTLPGLKKD
jgi:hypothetical protein